MILALETATDVCSVALRDSNGEIFEKRTEERGTHSEKLFRFINELKEEHRFEIGDLEGVIVSRGPGSYTGLRISASAVKGLLFHQNIPLFSVNTLASFAARVLKENPDNNRIHAVIDARRVHVYHQLFKVNSGNLYTDDDVEVIPIKGFEAMVKKGDSVIGTGLERIDDEVLDKLEIYGQPYISAASLFFYYDHDGPTPFAEKADPDQFEPRYYTSRQVK